MSVTMAFPMSAARGIAVEPLRGKSDARVLPEPKAVVNERICQRWRIAVRIGQNLDQVGRSACFATVKEAPFPREPGTAELADQLADWLDVPTGIRGLR